MRPPLQVDNSVAYCADTPEVLDTTRSRRSIALLVDFDDQWRRDVLAGAARFAAANNWDLLLAPRDTQRRLRAPRYWQGDGVIAAFDDPATLDHVRRLGLPTVDVANTFPLEPWLGRVTADDAASVRMAFEHLRNRHFTQFACFAPEPGRYSRHRSLAFKKVVTSAGFECAELPNSTGDFAVQIDWLQSLPTPVAVYAPDPYTGRLAADLCSRRGIDVPRQVAIIAGDEDNLLCAATSPEVTAVQLASQRIGVEACRMLKEMLDTGIVPSAPGLVSPLRVCPRRSTDYSAISDPTLSEALRYISRHATDGIRVPDLVGTTALSRRSLEQRFRDVLGRSPAEEIRRVKVERARQLVVTTSLSVTQIAFRCGFSSGPYLAHAFRKQYGIVPTELRVGKQVGG